MTDRPAPRRPGPVYDDAMKVLADDDTAALLGLLGIEGEVQRLNVELTAPTLKADLLVRCPAGLVHVEFVKDPRPDLGARMLRYWGRVRERHPDDPIAQHLLVLGDGVAVPRRIVDCGVTCVWSVVRVAELDPTPLLAAPTTAALAALARGTSTERTATLAAAVARIRAGAAEDRGQALLGAAATLASIVLPRRIIDDVLKEADMPVLVRDTPYGREIYDEGRQEGRQEGRTEGRRAVLAALLRRRFGDDPRLDAVAARLASLPDEDGLTELNDADTLDELAG